MEIVRAICNYCYEDVPCLDGMCLSCGPLHKRMRWVEEHGSEEEKEELLEFILKHRVNEHAEEVKSLLSAVEWVLHYKREEQEGLKLSCDVNGNPEVLQVFDLLFYGLPLHRGPRAAFGAVSLSCWNRWYLYLQADTDEMLLFIHEHKLQVEYSWVGERIEALERETKSLHGLNNALRKAQE